MRRRPAVSIHARLERVRVVRCGMAQHRDEYPDTVKAVSTRLRSSRGSRVQYSTLFGNSCQVSEVTAPTIGHGNAATGEEQAKVGRVCASGECSFVRCAEE
jgi:hypothetical protein